MNIQHHEVSVKIVNSYQSLEVINAFYALFDCRPHDIRIVHQFHPETCDREITVYAGTRAVKNFKFDMKGTQAVRILISKQIREEHNYLQRMVLRDVYNFLQQVTIDYHQSLLEKVQADYREVDDVMILHLKNIS
jgi:hypothetical protein